MTNEYQDGRRAQPYTYEGGLIEDPEYEFPIMPPTPARPNALDVERDQDLYLVDCGLAPQDKSEVPVTYFNDKILIASQQRCTHARNTDDGESLVDKVFRLRR
jgi:hypothetical protein